MVKLLGKKSLCTKIGLSGPMAIAYKPFYMPVLRQWLHFCFCADAIQTLPFLIALSFFHFHQIWLKLGG